jgi:hypothetical protein
MVATRPPNGRSRFRRDFGTSVVLFPSTSRTPILRMLIFRSFDGFLPPVHRTDGPDYVGGSDLDFSRFLVNGNADFPMCLNVDGAGSPPRVSLPTDGPDPIGFHNLQSLDSYDLENPEFPMADIPMSCRDFSPPATHEGLTSMWLPVDRTTVGVSSQIQWLRSVLPLFSPPEA